MFDVKNPQAEFKDLMPKNTYLAFHTSAVKARRLFFYTESNGKFRH